MGYCAVGFMGHEEVDGAYSPVDEGGVATKGSFGVCGVLPL